METSKNTAFEKSETIGENIHVHIIHNARMKWIVIVCLTIGMVFLSVLFLIDKKRVDKVYIPLESINRNMDTIFTVLKVLVHNDSVADIQLRHFPTSAPMDLINMTKVASVFQNRVDPITKKRQFHWGVDYDAGKGTKVYSSAEGTVEEADWNDGYGRYIKINHTNGYETVYAHLDSIMIHKGETVKKGELIGLVGSSGMTTGNHLHYEIYYLNQHINPVVFTTTY